jgi:hypothetical protein
MMLNITGNYLKRGGEEEERKEGGERKSKNKEHSSHLHTVHISKPN